MSHVALQVLFKVGRSGPGNHEKSLHSYFIINKSATFLCPRWRQKRSRLKAGKAGNRYCMFPNNRSFGKFEFKKNKPPTSAKFLWEFFSNPTETCVCVWWGGVQIYLQSEHECQVYISLDQVTVLPLGCLQSRLLSWQL